MFRDSKIVNTSSRKNTIPCTIQLGPSEPCPVRRKAVCVSVILHIARGHVHFKGVWDFEFAFLLFA